MAILKFPFEDKDGIIKVTYAAKKFGPHATNVPQPYMKLKPSFTRCTLSYEVFFPEGFNFVRGGKLPGLCSEKAVSGGNKKDGDFSMRLMWRSGGNGEVYAYVPPKRQTKEYSKCCTESNPSYGDSIQRGSFKFQTGKWNKIELCVKLNDVGKSNGSVELSHNGKKVIDVDCIMYRTSDDTKIQYCMFSTFFGGSTPDWAPSTPQYAKFRNFVISN